MPTVTYDRLWVRPTPPLQSKQSFSTDVFDVTHGSTVNLIIGVTGAKRFRKEMTWSVQFGPYSGGGYATCREGDFEARNIVAVSVPVFGPQLRVTVRNDSIRVTRLRGNIRIIHDLTP